MPRKKNQRSKIKGTVTITIEKGLVSSVQAPKGVNVVIHDYDTDGWDFLDHELKTDSKNKRYAEEVWEGEDA